MCYLIITSSLKEVVNKLLETQLFETDCQIADERFLFCCVEMKLEHINHRPSACPSGLD